MVMGDGGSLHPSGLPFSPQCCCNRYYTTQIIQHGFYICQVSSSYFVHCFFMLLSSYFHLFIHSFIHVCFLGLFHPTLQCFSLFPKLHCFFFKRTLCSSISVCIFLGSVSSIRPVVYKCCKSQVAFTMLQCEK